ncbi:MAG TPA: sensor histidine kinase N-terminal domain-containing protein [Burkholderiaceae bacterium]|nr:sensor histidine kinase N-terminal domain-containing protein [Burkholderiaceae bacterium]
MTSTLHVAGTRNSLRRSLLLWLLLPLIVLVPLSAALMYYLSVRPALDSLDRALTGNVAALADLLSETPEGAVSLGISEQTVKALLTDPFDTVAFAVRDPGGRLLQGDSALAALRPALARGEWLFFDAVLHGQPVRVAAYGAPCDVHEHPTSCPVLVAESVVKRSQAEQALIVGTGITLLLLAMALVLFGVVAVGRSLRPLQRLSTDIEHRSLENLQPIDAAGVPSEVAPLVAALNRLLERLRDASLAQQAFLADAAHQLRTPLTALRTESELALLEPHPPTLDATLLRLNAGAQRAARLAHQLLALARADSAAQNAAATPVDLRSLCQDAAQEWVGPALEAGIDLGFELEPAWARGRAFMLRELLANLLHNAIEYAGRGARVTVRTCVRGAQAVLEVEDNGPGIPEADRERVWGRFQRGTLAGGSGSGLGLAIVRDIAAGHGASTSMESAPGGRGLLMRIAFPAFARASTSEPARPAPAHAWQASSE